MNLSTTCPERERQMRTPRTLLSQTTPIPIQHPVDYSPVSGAIPRRCGVSCHPLHPLLLPCLPVHVQQFPFQPVLCVPRPYPVSAVPCHVHVPSQDPRYMLQNPFGPQTFIEKTAESGQQVDTECDILQQPNPEQTLELQSQQTPNFESQQISSKTSQETRNRESQPIFDLQSEQIAKNDPPETADPESQTAPDIQSQRKTKLESQEQHNLDLAAENISGNSDNPPSETGTPIVSPNLKLQDNQNHSSEESSVDAININTGKQKKKGRCSTAKRVFTLNGTTYFITKRKWQSLWLKRKLKKEKTEK